MDTEIYGTIKNKESQKQLIEDLRDIPHLCGNVIRDESIKVIEECADLLEITLGFKPITIYPNPKNFRALSYQEVRDRIKSFESSACSEIWVFDGLLNGGRSLLDFGLNKVFAILSDKCGENYLFIEKIQF